MLFSRKPDYFLDKPEWVKISLTNVCNFRCTMCFNPFLKEKRGFMQREVFYKILAECDRVGIGRLSLGATGEVFLHKNFVEFLKLAKSKNLWVSTTTNCSLLTQEISDLLVQYKIDRIGLSVYSFDPESHKKYTGSDTFYQVVDNIKYFLDLVDKDRTIVDFRFLDIPDVNNYKKFADFWGPIVGKVVRDIPFKKMINWSGLNNRFLDDAKLKKGRQIRCPHIRYYLHVTHEGDVLPCCNIPEGYGCTEILFGNLKKDSIMDIWKSKKYLSFKKNHSQKVTASYKPCANCSSIYEIKRPFLARAIDYIKYRV